MYYSTYATPSSHGLTTPTHARAHNYRTHTTSLYIVLGRYYIVFKGSHFTTFHDKSSGSPNFVDLIGSKTELAAASTVTAEAVNLPFVMRGKRLNHEPSEAVTIGIMAATCAIIVVYMLIQLPHFWGAHRAERKMKFDKSTAPSAIIPRGGSENYSGESSPTPFLRKEISEVIPTPSLMAAHAVGAKQKQLQRNIADFERAQYEASHADDALSSEEGSPASMFWSPAGAQMTKKQMSTATTVVV